MVEEHQGIRLPVELQQVPSRILEVLSAASLKRRLLQSSFCNSSIPNVYRSTYELALSSSQALSRVV